MAARKTRFQTGPTRAKIQAGNIINRLQKHIDGAVEMSSSQVTAALGLLRKTLPDLKSSEVTIEDNRTDAGTLSRAELERIASRGSNGADKAAGRADKPSSVH